MNEKNNPSSKPFSTNTGLVKAHRAHIIWKWYQQLQAWRVVVTIYR